MLFFFFLIVLSVWFQPVSFSLYQSKKPPILAATLRVASFLLPEAISQIFPSSYVTWVPC